MARCKHLNTELRYKIICDGRKQYTRQCISCGAQIGQWEKAPPKELIDQVQEFDQSLNDHWQQAAPETHRRKQKEQQLNRHQQYEDYINNSPEWQQRRALVLRRCNSICEACLKQRATQVHHLTYNSLYQEILWELRGVCPACHSHIHGRIVA
jgi:hypothetical protein